MNLINFCIDISISSLGSGGESEQDHTVSDNTVRFWCPELTQEGQWHHLVLIFHRAGIMKNSSVSLFVDGEHMETQKVSLLTIYNVLYSRTKLLYLLVVLS